MALAAAGALVAATVAGCSTTPGKGHKNGAAPNLPPPGTVVMIIRHGEKPAKEDSLPGIDATGRPDDSSLTQVGWNRAHRLVDVFDGGAGQSRPGVVVPKALYAAGANDNGEGTRTRETVQPLADKLGLTVNTSFGKGEEQQLADAVVKGPGPALISWQHGEIPDIADSFGAVTPEPPKDWPDKRFDMIWILTATTDGWTFQQIPEMVLPGDSGTPIKE
jgi:hypothetical protein